jgi:hypothetical protein
VRPDRPAAVTTVACCWLSVPLLFLASALVRSPLLSACVRTHAPRPLQVASAVTLSRQASGSGRTTRRHHTPQEDEGHTSRSHEARAGARTLGGRGRCELLILRQFTA